MISKYAPKTYEETRDSISWAFVTAPSFKGERTLDEVFEDLFYGVELVRSKTKSKKKMEAIEETLTKLREAKAALIAGDVKVGNQALFDAGQAFRSLR